MIVLVDSQDRAVGVGDKMDVHRRGLLHRAFSAFVFDSAGRLLLHQRSFGKYHCGGLWTNTCCSHPGPDEPVAAAGERRLAEEMGFSCALTPLFGFEYRAELDGGLVEHEYDHVLVGASDDTPAPDPEEVAAYEWVALDEVERRIHAHPERFTPWFKIALPRVVAALREPPPPVRRPHAAPGVPSS